MSSGTVISKRAFESVQELKLDSKFSCGETVTLSMLNGDTIPVTIVHPSDNQHYVVATHITGDYYAVLNPVPISMLQSLVVNPTKEAIRKRITDFCLDLDKQFDVNKSLSDNGFDSLDAVELLVTVESDLDINFDIDSSVPTNYNVDQLVELIYEQCMDGSR